LSTSLPAKSATTQPSVVAFIFAAVAYRMSIVEPPTVPSSSGAVVPPP